MLDLVISETLYIYSKCFWQPQLPVFTVNLTGYFWQFKDNLLSHLQCFICNLFSMLEIITTNSNRDFS